MRQHTIFNHSQECMGQQLGAVWILAAILIMHQQPLCQVPPYFTFRIYNLFVSLLKAGKIPSISYILL